MSPIHLLVWLLAICFQLVNGLSIGGWISGYGPLTPLDWQESAVGYDVGARVGLGLLVWTVGYLGNMYHDDELREIRRAAIREQKKKESAEGGTGPNGKSVDKVYMIPQNGLFRWILYPHYVLEWVEWTGFWLLAGWDCVPARNFLLNEITAMVPRALRGLPWYINRFGKERVGNRKALIPGVL
jgi:3-oxo-5-alpha-steroid 4-dehydrogenase 1